MGRRWDDLCGGLASGAIVAKGEFTLVVDGSGTAPENETALDAVLEALLEELPTSQAARLGAVISGTSRRQAYQRALHLKR